MTVPLKKKIGRKRKNGAYSAQIISNIRYIEANSLKETQHSTVERGDSKTKAESIRDECGSNRAFNESNNNRLLLINAKIQYI